MIKTMPVVVFVGVPLSRIYDITIAGEITSQP